MRLLPLLLVSLAVAGCASDQTPEQRIHDQISAIEHAVEEGALSDVSALLHRDYRDTWHPDRRSAVRSLFGYLQRHRDIHLFTVVRSVEIAEDASRADAVVFVAMTGIPVDSVETLVSLNADLYRFDVQFIDDDGDWLVTESRWERAGSDMFSP